jgi:uncharacterized protein YuzE
MPNRKVKEIICELLDSNGIHVNGDLKAMVRFGKDHGLVRVEHFNKLVEYFPDADRIYFECTDVIVRKIEPKKDYTIGFIWIEVEHSRKLMTVKVVTDDEETWTNDITYLEDRHKKLTKAVYDSLYLLTFL